jgi:DNA-binding response OmpR family regulator
MPSILLIEDDLRIRESIARSLAESGYVVDSRRDGMAGVQAAVESDVDLVILDLGLPDIDGREVLKMIRAVSRVPVIVATARDEQAEIVRLLDLGADDYIVKPYSASHLEARIRAVLRRTGAEESTILTIGGLIIDQDAHEARLDGELLDLAAKEFDMLAYLAANPGKMVSKREILAQVWRLPYGGADKTVDVHLSWLRRKLGETAAEPRYIHTRRGVGVKLVDPDA